MTDNSDTRTTASGVDVTTETVSEPVSEAPAETAAEADVSASPDPVRRWTLWLLLLALVLLTCYLIADRITPYSSQARVHALVVPAAPEVAGTVTAVFVASNQVVAAGDPLFTIDPTQYELAVASAEAELAAARQATGVSTAAVTGAEAGVRTAAANLENARQDVERLRRIKAEDAGALSDRRIESAETGLTVARQQLVVARANLEQAQQNLGEQGDDNSRVRQALAALGQVQANLDDTVVRAPTAGVVTDVRVDVGNFAGAGQPQMTFVSTEKVWVRADFTENNLGHIQPGDEAGLIFDIYPGRIFHGTVTEMGYGVAVDSAPLGSLPTINNDRQWLRSAQRFPVIVAFEMSDDDLRRLRVGAQASVLVYASENKVFNALGALYLRIGSLLSYAY